MAVNKVIYGGNTLVDLTGDTVTAADLADGVKATGADGNPVIGLMQKVTIDAELSTTSTNPVQNKVIKAALDGKLGKNETAARATQDGAGNTISTTYAKKTDIPTITVDAALSNTSTNPVQNKVVTTHMDDMITQINDSLDIILSDIPTKVSHLENDAGYLTQHQSLDGYAKTSVANTWTAEQSLNNVNITYERYTASSVSGTSTSATPTASTAVYTATGNFTLYLNSIASNLANGQTTVFTAYINANADYALSISVTGVVKYIGNASDAAITSAGLLLNIMMLKDARGNLTSIVQASKLS